jgi:hypothetical protein
MRNVELSNAQRAILHAMVLREARSLGYGTRYHPYNRSAWPRKLKQMEKVAAQLKPERKSHEPR